MGRETVTISKTTFPGERGWDLYRLYRDGQYVPLLSVDETAQALRVSSKTVRRLIAAGRLSYLRVGRRVLLLTEDVDEYIRRRMCSSRDLTG